MREISQLRFNALAGYCRDSYAQIMFEELQWYEHAEERVLGVIVRDRKDGDFSGAVLARDRKSRFRAISLLSHFEKSKRRAEVLLRREMEKVSMLPEEQYYQGDEDGGLIDFFSPRVEKEKMDDGFIKLSEQEGFSPARGIIESMMHWYEDPDGNFIEQFQSAGFSARLWELYLFATFREMGYGIKGMHAVPDFECEGLLGSFSVEATTVNLTRNDKGELLPLPPRGTPEEVRLFLHEYMPIKYGSALTSKLAKKYWKEPHLKGKPLLLAVHDYMAPFSMTYTRSGLGTYLYGFLHEGEYDENGRLAIIPKKIDRHQYGKKIISSGFFNLPEAENISGVIFSNSATISKFNRIGMLADFGSKRVRMIREGVAFNPDPNASEPISFKNDVDCSSYSETWAEGLEVFHNPNAVNPVSPEMFPGAAHHRLMKDGQVDSLIPEWHPLSSVTVVLLIK